MSHVPTKTKLDVSQQPLGEAAAALVSDGMKLGLGTGRAAVAFIRALGARVQQGLSVQGVPTSVASAQLAQELGIPLATLDEVDVLDLAVDGSDEVDPHLNLIKGLGGALIREKVVATSAKRLVILVGADKLAPALGTRGVLPVEVVPFALSFCQRRLRDLGWESVPRQVDGQLYHSDNGNPILDVLLKPLPDPAATEQAIAAIPGVVGTGFFLGMAHMVLVQDGPTVRTLKKR